MLDIQALLCTINPIFAILFILCVIIGCIAAAYYFHKTNTYDEIEEATEERIKEYKKTMAAATSKTATKAKYLKER